MKLKWNMERVLLKHAVDEFLTVYILHMTDCSFGFTGFTATFRAGDYEVQVDTVSMHFHVAFLVGFVSTKVKVTGISAFSP